MNVTVYLGSSPGSDPRLNEKVRELGTWIGSGGNTLVYGGSKSGLMGQLAEAVMDSGGKVIGVEPEEFISSCLQLDTITQLIVTADFPERRTRMIELGDMFIAFPGGTGTLEEISEVMRISSMSRLNAPCILYNIDGYYEGLKALLDKMLEKGMSTPERLSGIYFPETLEEIVRIAENFRDNPPL